MNKYDLLKNTERLPPISQPARQLTNIKLSELVPFDKQPFKPYTDEKLEELAQSISDNGLLSPILVRPYGGKYQIIAGHNRVLACRLLGHNEISAVTLNLDDDSAAVALVEDNLNARLEFAHSEKALA
ncbi:MAG: ParB/RepB/Spo0J family partition protein, partial [Angelakisella sp.]